MRTALVMMLAAGLVLTPVSVPAASPTSYDAVRDGLLAVWAEMPLSARHVTLTDGPATGFGAYSPRADAAYAPGDKIYVYFELAGYGFADDADGFTRTDVDVDLELRDGKGNVVASRQGIATLALHAREKPLESYLSLSGSLGAFPPGDYTLRYLLHDRIGGKEGEAAVTMTLSGDSASSAPAN